MKQRFLENEKSIIVISGLVGSGKSAVISRILHRSDMKYASTAFSKLALLTVAKSTLLITNIVTSTTTELQNTLTSLINIPNKLKTLILEVTLSTPQQLSHLSLGPEVSWYYILSPHEITSRPSLPPHISCVSVDVTRVREWQIAAHALRAYHAAPDTFSTLSNLNIAGLPALENSEVFGVLTRDFKAVSMRTLWFFVKVLSHVVDITTRRIPEIAENFGDLLVIYTKNVGLMIANQIEQVLRMFSGEFDPSLMFAVFPKCSSQWQQLECNRTSDPASTCQAHLQRLISECSEHYYKHIDVDTRLEKGEDDTVTGALINLLGFEIPESEETTSRDGDNIILSPKFCSLMIQMILKMETNVPVILWGREGSGKSALIRCLRSLYAKCRKQCNLISHDPVLQGENDLVKLLQRAPNSDLTVVVVQLSRRDDVNQVLNMITNRVLSGHICSENIKFVVEFTDESLKECFDRHDVITVKVDEIVVERLLEHLGLPTEVYKLLQSFLLDSSVSYRNVINLAKVYSWVDQVFLNMYQHLLMPSDAVSKKPCVLVLAAEICFGELSDELIDDIAKHFSILPDRDILLNFTLDYVSKVLFKRSSSSIEVSSTLFLILISLKTRVPLVLNTQIVQPAELQELLSADPLLAAHKCSVRVVDKTSSAHAVLESHWECLSECVTLVEGDTASCLKSGVVIYEGSLSMAPAATKRIITELVKCKAIRPGTPDLSLVILIPENTVPLELGSCLLGAGVNRDTSEHPPCLNAERSCVPSNQVEVELRGQSYGPNWETSELLTSESNHLDSLPIKDKDGPFSLISWIKKNINLPVDNLQSIASAVLIVKQLLKEGSTRETVSVENLENILSKWGEILQYICLVPPSIVKRTSQLAKVTKSNFLLELIELRLGELCTKEIFTWSNAYNFYTEIRLLSAYSESDKIRTLVQPLLWYCDMSAMFCKVKKASLSQYLTVIRDLKSGADRSFSHFSSWVDHPQDSRVLVYFLILLIRDGNFSLTDLRCVLEGVLEVVDNVKVLCVLFRQIFWTYGVKSLDEICKEIRLVETSSVCLSALVCVYQSEVLRGEVPLKTLPETMTVRNIALVRQTLLQCCDVLVDFYNEYCGQDKSLVDVGEYFKNKSSFCILTTLISEANNTAIRQFILRQLLEKRGTDCLKYFLSALPDLQLDTVDSEDVVDVNEVIPGYSSTKSKVTPVCTLCCNDHDSRQQLDKGVASLLYYQLTLQSRSVQCDCLYRSLPGHVTSSFNILPSLGIHGRIAVYLASQLSSVNNPFMGYFSYLLHGSDLDNIYWMGMPHDDLFEIINTVKPSEKYAGVEKVYTFYKCPRGHVYSINNCGDPLQREKCPECKEVIGGRDHIAAEQNTKFDPDEKQRIETGYTLRDDEFKPGTTYIRQLSQLSTAVLWYLTHTILSLRDNPFIRPSDPTFDVKQRLEETFAGIMDKLGVSPDVTLMFLLDVVNKLSVCESDVIYKTEIVHDSLKAQDILIMKKLNDLKSLRSLWEKKFDDVVSKTDKDSQAVKNEITKSDFCKNNRNNCTDENQSSNSKSMDVIGNPCYWFTENISRIPLIFLRNPDNSDKERKKNKQLQAFKDKYEKLEIINRLPLLLNMLKNLTQSLSYRADFRILFDSASHHFPQSDINIWYETWIELEATWDKSKLSYSIAKMKPQDELILFDIVPTNYFSGPTATCRVSPNCQSGSVSLAMIKYLSELQNELVPEQPKTTQLEKCRYLYFNPKSLAPFLCDNQAHLTNYFYCRLIMPLSRLPTDQDVCLQALSSRVLYWDKEGEACKNIVRFYRSQQYHSDLECSEQELLENLEVRDLWSCHKILTGLLSGLGASEITHNEFLDALNLETQVAELLGRVEKLFAVYRQINLLCVRWTLLTMESERDHVRNHVLGELLSHLLLSEMYNKPCTIPHFSEEGRECFLSLLAEFVTLKILNVDPPEYFVGWELGEALEFYLEEFGNRDVSFVGFVGEEVKVDNVGFLLNCLVQDKI